MPDITKTRTELKTAALSALGVLENGQTADSNDLAAVDEYVDPVIANLNTREVVYIGDDEAIEVEFFTDLAYCVAFTPALCKQFGVPPDPAGVEMAEERLRVASRKKPAPNKYLNVDKAVQSRRNPMTLSRFLSGNFW